MKTIQLGNGYLTLAESKAICPHCKMKIEFDEIEDKFIKQSNHYIRLKCKCKRFIGITQDFRGDYVAYNLTTRKMKNKINQIDKFNDDIDFHEGVSKSLKRFRAIAALITIAIGVILTAYSIRSDVKYKNYVIENSDKIRRLNNAANVFTIDTCELGYYQDVTIRINSDSCYTLVFWGNRESWLWNVRLDKYFTVDIPYSRYKGKNISKDVSVINSVAHCR